MSDSLILVDVGNTAMKVGFFSGQTIKACSLPTDCRMTAGQLGQLVEGLLAKAGLGKDSCSACAVCSVVPAMDELVRGAMESLGLPVRFVPADLPVPLENRYEAPEKLGADRLLSAWAARRLYPESPALIVIDFGTAATFDCVQDNAFLGGLIFPGPMTALSSLAGATAKLPAVSLEEEEAVLYPGRDTASCIRRGVLFGFASMVEGLVARLKRQLASPCTVIGTGGLAPLFARHCPELEKVDKGLVLQGLALLCGQDKGAMVVPLLQDQDSPASIF